ncbi:PD-(D/E)XK motif protein [Streptomyces europaeiscabiei]|uniref:PD-(D/E)XK motif protein n=1 Tax=Streptomyces europaeiscabiei TaxID=146819 RepID=UPI0029A1EC01|nr:PD-(D/E)XK motif protein [Streptomyces europaeiscabiei]MDX3711251.1 PD-(D/E)XK motif protein [Streptomyces europaeiscabiei]MDX3840101.1 PD-(D/E)XK motif protein [Streptomyces europaeiscabiei]
MNDDTLGSLVEERWTALEAAPATGERRLRVAQLPVTGHHGPLAVGVDHGGHRHLLVPVHAHRKLRPGLDGPVLRLRKRALEDEDTYQTYADLSCMRDDLNDLFTELCVDVLEAAKDLPENPVKALYRVLDRWKALFRTQEVPLGSEQLAGLFGELTLLNRLLGKDSSAHRLWRGPVGHRHDFSTGVTAVEVKASTATEGRRPQIHGLDQLEAPEGGELCLVWFRLRRSTVNGSGTAVVDLVDRTLHLCDDEGALLELLAQAGYRPADANHYHDVRFVISEEQWYSVGPGFPGLTGQTLVAAGIPISILDVEYTIDLSGETPAPMDPDQVSRVIDGLIQESL